MEQRGKMGREKGTFNLTKIYQQLITYKVRNLARQYLNNVLTCRKTLKNFN